GDDTDRESFHGTPLVLPHLTMDEARPFPCPMPACGGSVVQSYTILFVRARKIGSRSGSYVRFVDLVNEPALDGGPREDAHESALIPNPIDQNPWAHWRSPMDMMRQG